VRKLVGKWPLEKLRTIVTQIVGKEVGRTGERRKLDHFNKEYCGLWC
jgi:hypothetical protein